MESVNDPFLHMRQYLFPINSRGYFSLGQLASLSTDSAYMVDCLALALFMHPIKQQSELGFDLSENLTHEKRDIYYLLGCA